MRLKDFRSQLEKSGLWRELSSGYDIELISELQQAGQAVPSDRVGLYESLVRVSCNRLNGGQIALTLAEECWRLWKSRERLLAAGQTLREQDLRHLSTDSPRLMNERHAHGAVLFEFRHDAMLAYLAARYLAEISAGNIDLGEEALSDSEKLWASITDESQVDFWHFYVALVRNEDTARRLFTFAIQRPALRVLQKSLLQRWPIAILIQS